MPAENFTTRAVETKTALTASKGLIEGLSVDVVDKLKCNILTDMPAAIKELDYLRKGNKEKTAVEVSMAQYVKEKWGFAPDNNGKPDSFFECLGIDASRHTVDSLWTMPDFDEGFRWLVPEIFRDAIRTGLRKAPIYPNLIALEENITQPSVIMPWINMSEATAKKMNEAESFSVGQVSFNQKTVEVSKIGIGLSITDEVIKFSSLNILSTFLQDVGVKLGLALDTEAITTLIDGDQADGSDSIAVIGTIDGTTYTYKDILRLWIRMGRIGRLPAGMLSNEGPAIDVLQLAEFKGFAGESKTQQIIIRTPVPQTQNFWVHGAMEDNDQLMFIDPTAALIKLNIDAMTVESERIANKQINNTYASMRTGFATMFRDARAILDRSVAFSGAGFPAWFDVSGQEVVNWK